MLKNVKYCIVKHHIVERIVKRKLVQLCAAGLSLFFLWHVIYDDTRICWKLVINKKMTCCIRQVRADSQHIMLDL